MNEVQYQELVAKLGEEAAKKIKAEFEALEAKQKELLADKASAEEVKALKAELAQKHEELKAILKEQGIVLAEVKASNAAVTAKKDLEQFVKEKAPELKEIQRKGHGMIEVELKAAGIQGVSTSITDMAVPPGSPYLGTGLVQPVYNQIYNPNFILNYVDVGSTALSTLPWVNETAAEGGAAVTAEGVAKPMFEATFQNEVSKAKKIGAYATLTDEFEADVPGLATMVRRLLQENVVRKFNDTIQAAVIAVAPGFTITSMDDLVDNADNYAAILAGMTQITTKNFQCNLIALNPVTAALMSLQKATDGHYIVPPFMKDFAGMIIQSNKVAAGSVLMGDLKQYKVDIYKDYTLKMGYINDDLAKGQFSIVGEVRYHNYISDNRKAALTYYNLATVAAQLEKP